MNLSELSIRTDGKKILVEPAKTLFNVLLLHGYGGSKEEMLPLSYRLALEGIGSAIIDLPGHGEDDDFFNFENVRQAIDDVLGENDSLQAMVGHSLGARLALLFDLPVVAISPPLDLFFEGRRSQMMSVLRCHNVREEEPYAGLKSVFDKLAGAAEGNKVLTIYGGRDLKTVKDFAKTAKKKDSVALMIRYANHYDILSSRESCKLAALWLRRNVKKN